MPEIDDVIRIGNQVGMIIMPASAVFWLAWSAWQWLTGGR